MVLGLFVGPILLGSGASIHYESMGKEKNEFPEIAKSAFRQTLRWFLETPHSSLADGGFNICLFNAHIIVLTRKRDGKAKTILLSYDGYHLRAPVPLSVDIFEKNSLQKAAKLKMIH